MTESVQSLSATALSAWTARVFARATIPDQDAATAAAVLVSANLRGVDTHGVIRLPMYIRRLRQGIINPRPEIRSDRDGPASALVDGDNGLGMVVGAWAMREAMRRAQAEGAAFVGVRRSSHFGAAAFYAQLASAAEQIGLCATNAAPSMAPWGSVTSYLGTNPLAISAPGGIEGGIVLDMATSQVAWGKVWLAARAGQSIPLSWATDAQGRPTNDPDQALKGLMLPLGGYKGAGLSIMLEVLCAILTGASVGPEIEEEQGVGHFFMALDIAHFIPVEEFKARLGQYVGEIHACQPAEGTARLYVPGEIEMEMAARRRREGIPLPLDVVADLVQLGRDIGEPFLV